MSTEPRWKLGWYNNFFSIKLLILEVLILLDPPSKYFYQDLNSSIKVQVENRPYRGGYIDFTPSSDGLSAGTGPSRNSAYDDVCYYLSQRVIDSQDNSPQEIPARILKYLVLSHTAALIEHIKCILTTLEEELRGNSDDLKSHHWLTFISREIFSWSHRLSGYCDYVEAAFDSLHISRDSSSYVSRGTEESISLEQDFRYVRRRMLSLKARADTLFSSFTAKQSLETARLSLYETSVARALTFFATIIGPLLLTTGLFSMGQSFAPGGSKFWLYWAIALPLACVTVVGTYFGSGLYQMRDIF